jgi:hypothetical protein
MFDLPSSTKAAMLIGELHAPGEIAVPWVGKSARVGGSPRVFGRHVASCR